MKPQDEHSYKISLATEIIRNRPEVPLHTVANMTNAVFNSLFAEKIVSKKSLYEHVQDILEEHNLEERHWFRHVCEVIEAKDFMLTRSDFQLERQSGVSTFLPLLRIAILRWNPDLKVALVIYGINVRNPVSKEQWDRHFRGESQVDILLLDNMTTSNMPDDFYFRNTRIFSFKTVENRE